MMDSGLGSDDEEIPLLPRWSPTARGSSWPNIYLLIIVFFQVLGIYQSDEVVRNDCIKYVQHTDLPGHRPWVLIAGGNLIAFIVILLFESVTNLDPMAVSSVTGAYGFGASLFILGMAFLLPTLLAFTADQVEQTPRNVSSNMRWVCWTIYLALAAFDGYFAFEQLTSFEEHRYYQTIRHAAMLGIDVISIALFMFGRSRFNISTAAKGKVSYNEMISTVKRHVLCMTRKMSPAEEHMTNAEWEKSTRRERVLQRLKLKKGVFFFMFLSSMSFAWSVMYEIRSLLDVSYYWRHHWLLPVLTHSRYVIILVAVPIMELVIRRFGRPLWQDTTTNLMKTIGVGALLTALALAFIGGSDMYSWDAGKDITGIKFMVLPPFIVMGLATLMMLPPGFAHWYVESAPGLETFSLTLGVSLGFFPLALGAVGSNVVIRDIPRGILSYILAAVALGFLVICYIPSVIWYGRATTAVNKFLASEQEEDQSGDRNGDHFKYRMQGDQSRLEGNQSKMQEDQSL